MTELEQQQIVANVYKLNAERFKLLEEAGKLKAEQSKLLRDRTWHPVVVGLRRGPMHESGDRT